MALASRLEALAGPSAPVLLIHGERDGVVPIAQARSTASALGGRANVLFGEAGHHLDPLFDEAIVRFVIDWIDARQVRGLPR
jgi:pimeloyl-ACP methyl ester carboxylesterase